MLQQLAVIIIRMTHGPVSEHNAALVHRSSLSDQLRNSAMDIGLADDRNAFLVEKRISGARHDADLILQSVPALDSDGVTAIFLCQALHGNLQGSHVLKEVLLDVADHVLMAVVDNICDFRLLFFPFAHLGIKLGKRDRRQLNVEFLQQLALVAHGAPEVERSRSDLKDSGVTEYFNHVTDSQEIADAALKLGVFQVAVVHVGERNFKSSQHLACCEKAALGVAKTHAVLVGTLIPRSPKKDRNAKLLGQSSALVLCSEVCMGKEESVNFFFFKFLSYFVHALIVKQKAFVVDVVDIYKVDVQFTQAVCDESSEKDRRGSTEDRTSGRSVSKFDFCLCHGVPP